MKIISVIKSEYYKTARSLRRYFPLVLPLLYSLLFFSYLFSIRHAMPAEQWRYVSLQVFWQFLILALLIMMPIMIGLTNEFDQQATRYAWILQAPKPAKALFGCLLFFFLELAAVLALASVSYVLLMSGFSPMPIQWYIVFGQFALGTFYSLLPIIGLYYLSSLLLGLMPTILFGMFGVIMAAILGGTDLAGNFWPLFPFAWSMKFVQDNTQIQSVSDQVWLASTTGLLLINGLLWLVTKRLPLKGK